MKISVLTPDLSHNCLGRAWLLAKILQRHYEVEIIGPALGDGIWEPVSNDQTINYKFAKIYGRFKPYQQLKELSQKIDGDVIYASKPLFTSFGIGLLIKISQKKPLILDIDDWEKGFAKEYWKTLSFISWSRYLISSAFYLYRENSYWNVLFGEKFSCFADEITVSNNFLQKKFGGTVISHVRDTEVFNPSKFDKNSIRERNKIEKNKKVVIFFGTPRAHKGIEDLINAVNLIQNMGVVLCVVGIDGCSYSQKIASFAEEKLGIKFRPFGLQTFNKVPEFLAMADVVVIPQQQNFATMGQIPAKVFDAMAMARPIIASNVSDLPEILDGCGWIVPPENPQHLAKVIQYVLDHPIEATEMGQKARQKCIEKYSFLAVEQTLVKIFKKYARQLV